MNDSRDSHHDLAGCHYASDVMDRLARCSFPSLPTFSEQIGQKIPEDDHYQFTVEPSILEKSGVLANGVMIEVLDEGCSQMMHGGRSLIVEQLIINFCRLCRWRMMIRIEPQLVRRTRRSALVDFLVSRFAAGHAKPLPLRLIKQKEMRRQWLH